MKSWKELYESSLCLVSMLTLEQAREMGHCEVKVLTVNGKWPWGG